jgi:hypothetical protein
MSRKQHGMVVAWAIVILMLLAMAIRFHGVG